MLYNASGTAQWVAAHISAGTSPGTVDVDLSKAPAGHGPPLAVREPSQPFWLRRSSEHPNMTCISAVVTNTAVMSYAHMT